MQGFEQLHQNTVCLFKIDFVSNSKKFVTKIKTITLSILSIYFVIMPLQRHLVYGLYVQYGES